MKKKLLLISIIIFSTAIGHVSYAQSEFSQSYTPPVLGSEADFGQLLQFIINYSFYVVGIAIFGVVFWAGFTWFTAAGNSSKINEAKGKIYNAIIGAILLSSAYVLLYTINPDLVGGTFTLKPIAQPEGNGATAPHRCAGTPGTADYRGALLSAIQATIARNTEGIADLPNTSDNVMRFLSMVVAELETNSFEATETVLNGGGNPNRGDIIAVWTEGDTLMERYDVIRDAGGGSSIRNTIQAILVGHIPLDCTY